MSELIV